MHRWTLNWINFVHVDRRPESQLRNRSESPPRQIDGRLGTHISSDQITRWKFQTRERSIWRCDLLPSHFHAFTFYLHGWKTYFSLPRCQVTFNNYPLSNQLINQSTIANCWTRQQQQTINCDTVSLMHQTHHKSNAWNRMHSYRSSPMKPTEFTDPTGKRRKRVDNSSYWWLMIKTRWMANLKPSLWCKNLERWDYTYNEKIHSSRFTINPIIFVILIKDEWTMTLSVGLPTIKTTKSNNYNRITSEIYQHFTIGRTYNISEFLIRCSPQWDTVKKKWYGRWRGINGKACHPDQCRLTKLFKSKEKIIVINK